MLSTAAQAKHLMRLLLHMKRWKFIWSVIVLVSVLSNHVLFPIIDGWMGTMGQTYTSTGRQEFSGQNIILADTARYGPQLEALKSILGWQKANGASLVETCSNPEDCKAKMFSVMFGRIDTSRFSNFVNYNHSNKPRVECQMSHGGDLNCPYLGSLAVMSGHPESWKKYQYNEIRFFSLTSRKEGKKTDSVRGNTTMCAQHENFESVYSRTIMMQCIFIIGTVSFYFLVTTQACIAQLKRDGFLQLMLQKGLSVLAYWQVIGLITSVEIIVFAILFVISLTIQCPGFFNPVHMTLVFFMSLFYLMALTATSMVFSVTFGKYYFVGLMTVLVSILSMALVLINRMVISTITVLKLILLFIFPLGHFAEFVQGALLSEIRMESLSTYNMTILIITVLLAVGLVLGILVLDFTNDSGNGFRLPAGFFLKSEFWSVEPTLNMQLGSESSDPLYGDKPPPCANVEPVMESLRPLVRLSNLSKTFESRGRCGGCSSFTAIKDMSALVYENQITAIIGHNGAGKTTLLNLLTGAEKPTTGRASICGILVTSPLERLRLRGQLGICPQSMNFASCLTVEQTLQLLVVSCRLQWDACQEELTRMLKAARLLGKLKHLTSRLSTGQQRKLAVIMALIGNPRVLFLDEPTSGLDPESRRRMWRLLQEYRNNRAILISTQFMDEADTLADRKIFISSGALLCAGSSLFLKSAFDCGFVFEVTLKVDKHAQLLRKQICDEFKSVKVKKRLGVNLSFQLPAKDINFLPALAQALEKRMSLISAFGLLQASLYDIFIQLKDLDAKAVEEMFTEEKAGTVALDEDPVDTGSDTPTEINSQLSCIVTREYVQLKPTLLRQLRAMIVINVMRLVRNRMRLACRVIVPGILLLILIVTACIERSNVNHRIHLRNNMTNDGGQFKYGVCVFDEVPKDSHFSFVDGPRCSWMYVGRAADPSIGKNYLALEKPINAKLQDFLQEKTTVDKIEKMCRSRKPDAKPCPITYTSNWADSVPNEQRAIYFGTYDIYEKFNSSASASVSMGVYQKATDFFTYAVRSNEKKEKGKFFFSAESVYDYRSTFVPSLGAFFLILIMSFLPATFLDDIIEDKESRVRYQLATIGMSCLSYWLTNFIIHWLQYAVAYSLSVFLLMAIVQTGYSSFYFMTGVFLPILLFGLPSNQLMTYVLSTILDRSNHLVTIMYFFFSILLALIVLLVQLNNVASIILIAVLPPFAPIALTFYGVKTIFYALSYYNKDSISDITELQSSLFFSQPHVVAAFVAIIVHTVVLLTVLTVIENRIVLIQMLEARLQIQCTSELPTGTAEGFTDDPGVKEEMERIDSNPNSDTNLLEVSHLAKTYPNGTKVVRDISFSTGPAEIFGLLGPNGAGKTTTLSTIVGQLSATRGRCEVRHEDNWLPSGVAAGRGAIGYCPQYDPLYGCITALEHLKFYANIMGVPVDNSESLINDLADSLDLSLDKESPIDHLSVGIRRRLSLAISLLSEPSVLVIDEATTGVDPEGKRFLWQAIRAAATLTCTVIVTTHSMEEVEAICNRVTVINRGLLVGLGTVQELRTLYGRCYSLEILISTVIDEEPESIELKMASLTEAVTKKFNGTNILEEFHDRVHFSIPVASITRLSVALSWLLENRKSQNIQYFSLHQMSMDQVFERMVKQHDALIRRHTSIFSIVSERSENTSINEL